jgi:hypothetical protein
MFWERELNRLACSRERSQNATAVAVTDRVRENGRVAWWSCVGQSGVVRVNGTCEWFLGPLAVL